MTIMTIKTILVAEVVAVSQLAHAEEWSVADAKARLSELLETVDREGPQTITRRGRPVAVVVSVEEWAYRKRRQGTLADFFATSPLRQLGGELDIPPRDDQMREIDL